MYLTKALKRGGFLALVWVGATMHGIPCARQVRVGGSLLNVPSELDVGKFTSEEGVGEVGGGVKVAAERPGRGDVAGRNL